MKKILVIFLFSVGMAACNSSSDQKDTVGDSMTKDPQTGQPVTTNPDTVGPDFADTTTTN